MDELTSAFPIINQRYQISGTIATGGMAVIYKAQDLMLERPVVLKVLKKELSVEQAFQNRFRQEARSSAKLVHPNIVTTFDFGFDKDRLFIVFEFVDGVELKEIITSKWHISVEDAIHYLMQACRGLSYAHQQGLIHCDIKPQNMLVTNDHVLKITDFGISRALDTVTRDEHNDIVWGSPYYISPEQSTGQAPSPQSDLYSIGIVAYELFTRQLPFTADEPVDLIRMHRTELPKNPIEINPKIPDHINRIIMKCLEKEPVNRFHSASELEEALMAFSKNQDNRVSLTVEPTKREMNEKREDNFLKGEKKEINLSTILLSMLALILAGGLIPFWLYVLLTINSANR